MMYIRKKTILILLMIFIGNIFANNLFIGVSGGGNSTANTGVGEVPIAQSVELNFIKEEDYQALDRGEKVEQFLQLKYKAGFQIGINASYKFDFFRIGTNLRYNKFNYENVYGISSEPGGWKGPLFPGSVSGSGKVYTAFAFCDLDLNVLPIPIITPFVGAGIGVSRVINSISFVEKQKTMKQNIFSYMVQVGARAALANRLEIVVNLRYFRTAKVDAVNSNLNQGQFNIGVNYALD